MKAMMTWENWPLLLICLGMIAAAVIDWWKFKVPNWLTFSLILSGWLLGLFHNFASWFPDSFPFAYQGGVGGIGSSLAGTALGFFLLLPMLAIGGMGAGDVKMTMGFGSWVGAIFGLQGDCLLHILYAFCAGAIIGGVIAVGMIVVRKQFRQNLQHTRVILLDLITSGSIGQVAEKANQRRPRWHRLPYGVPLCLGFVGYLVLQELQVPPTRQPCQDGCAADSSFLITQEQSGSSSRYNSLT